MHLQLVRIVLIAVWMSACLAGAGQKLTSGALDELLGERDQNALDEVSARMLERELMRKLGQQLGEGLADGATTLSPGRRAELEETIDALLLVAAHRSGQGLRDEVGPGFRTIVQRDIVGTFSEGLRGELGDSLEATTQRVVERAMSTLERSLQDPSLRFTLGEIFRDAVYDAVEGGSPVSPGIGETLENTLTTKVLDPFSTSVNGVADRVAYQVNESARRTENLLKTIISGLVLGLLALGIAYFLRDRQARRARETSEQAREGLRSVGAAIEQLDEQSREQVKQKLSGYGPLLDEPAPPATRPGVGGLLDPRMRRRRAPRSDSLDRTADYERKDHEPPKDG